MTNQEVSNNFLKIGEKHMKVFISYSSKDKIFAEKLSRDLLKLDLDVWLDKWEIANYA